MLFAVKRLPMPIKEHKQLQQLIRIMDIKEVERKAVQGVHSTQIRATSLYDSNDVIAGLLTRVRTSTNINKFTRGMYCIWIGLIYQHIGVEMYKSPIVNGNYVSQKNRLSVKERIDNYFKDIDNDL